MYQGVIYTFASEAHRRQFLAEPEAYLPEYGGWCAFGFAMEPEEFPGWAPGTYRVDPESYRIDDGKLYLFYNDEGFDAKEHWARDTDTHRARADRYWREVVLEAMPEREHPLPDGMHPNAPPETAQLAWFIGEWDVVWKQKSDPSTEVYDLVTRARWRVSFTFDGFAIVDEFTGPNHAAATPWGDFRGMTFRAYDPNQRQWVMTYQHVNGSDAWRLTGQMNDGSFSLEAKDFEGRYQYRPRFFDITEDSFTWTNDVSVDGGETWLEEIARAEARRIR